ncbi:MAG TPA: HEAT repeat domain-containing protein [Anaeromyxobacter sp.]|nr:HEAT repeat domain-containing protein [Anaeromyxobacter sp.]
MATRETAGSGAGSATGGAGRSAPALRAARWGLFAVLLASAAITLFGLPELQRAVAEGRWPPLALAAGPALLLVFAIGYAAYRIVLVRAGRYPAGKALVRIAVIAAVVGVVAGIVRSPPDARAPGQGPVELARPLLSADPEVRALAAEVARHRPPAEALAVVSRLVALLEDRSPEVRRQARRSLVALAGRDVGGDGPDAAARWREYWRTAGR